MTRPDVYRESLVKLRQAALPERRESLLDGVKAFLTLILVCGAFYAASFVVASLQVMP